MNRWTADDPLLFLADVAGTTTGQNYFAHVKPCVEAFQEKVLDTKRITSVAERATLNSQERSLKRIFEAQRKRHVLVTGADVFANIEAEDD